MMAGLARICRLAGQMTITDKDGNKVIWLWDYVNEKPRPKTDMTDEEIRASEQAKWEMMAEQFKNKH